MKRGGYIKRRTPLNRANRARQAKRRAREFGHQADLCRTLPCAACGRSPSVAAHVRSRGAGGTDSDTVPLCWFCHGDQHSEGIRTFQQRRGLDLEALAAELAERVIEIGRRA